MQFQQKYPQAFCGGKQFDIKVHMENEHGTSWLNTEKHAIRD